MSLPPVAAAVPAEVRAAGPEAVERHQAAASFESLLVGRLTKTMLEDSSLADGPYADSVADAFAQGVTQAGGLGLTEALYRSMTLRTDS